MKKRCVSSIFALVGLLFLQTVAQAGSLQDSKPITPETAVLSRHSATLSAKESVTLSKGKFSVILPSSYVDGSFIVQTPDMQVIATEIAMNPIIIKNIPLVQTRTELLKKIEQLTVKISAIDARVKVLSSSQQVFASARDINSLDSAFGNRFEYLYTQKNILKEQQNELRKELRIVENALIKATGSVEPSYIQLNISLANTALEGTKEISYMYVAGNAGWNPVYQVDADIQGKKVSAKFTAEVWQRTALPWIGTTVLVTTATPNTSPEPAYLGAWNIGSYKPAPRATKMMMASNDVAQAGVATLEITGADAPMVESISNAMQWPLGKQSIPAGEVKVITISTTVFDADFLYTVRPYVSNEAYLSAKLDSKKTTTLPVGKALYSVANFGVGEGSFGYTSNSDKNKVYFGKDPLVTASMQSIKNEFTATKKEQKRVYQWKITIQNLRKTAVAVLVQDARPKTTSPQITISYDSSSPMPKIEGEFVEWEIPSLEYKKIATINYVVTTTAPVDIEMLSPR